MTRIGLYGVAGHMGRTLIGEINASESCTISGGCDRPGSPDLGRDIGMLGGLPALGIAVTDDAGAVCDVSDVIVDYSSAAATMALLPVAIAHRTPVLVCTTGFDADQKAALADAGRSIPILVGANMSASVIAMYELVKTAARLLGDDFDIEIFDFHPWDKIDAPSGTALELAEYAAEGRGAELSDLTVFARHGETGRRKRGSIGFSSARGGEVVCENTVFFAGAGQRLEIISRVTDYRAFAATTLRAAEWIAQQGPGYYSMDQMLRDQAAR
ncbi:4-hydroxy-tetrahydrodipicolinate reductase [Paracoccus litorisediminis]|uniref:4-hydroxy-tetrahydrodipicolinate reductase n=1 Tax=Paracoccus litorisediminis TaxID=2006130 RepID=A0A844HQZ3_9RHOB|nr:4-hydroxy-tetrahydrodipicolinate reductase [Paracoccus litorisediminis]MTH60844.1 4-hydroxy-tetrahydrodipicolinate reductase [Paracoccus litorisediminis]